MASPDPTNANTAFVLIPGSFSTPVFFDLIIPLLTKEGYTTHPTPLKSAGPAPSASMQDDAEEIRSQILQLAESGKDAILVMNSYGGIPGSEAAFGVSSKEREKAGLKGGVKALVYVASFLAKEGENILDMMGGDVPDSIKDSKEEFMTLNHEEDYKAIFSDLPDAEARRYMAQMTNHSSVSFNGKLSYAAYKYIPTTYIYTEEDQIILPEKQREMIKAANEDSKREGLREINVVSLKSGHVPMLSRPENIAEILVGVAKDL